MDPIFLDAFNALVSQLESNAIQLLTHPKKNSEKIEGFSMQLTEFKCGVLEMLEVFVRDQNQTTPQTSRKNERILQEMKR